MLSGSSVESLMQAFRDPSSPFHLREGETGPASPDELPKSTIQSHTFSTVSTGYAPVETDLEEVSVEAREYALSEGYDPDSFLEQKIVWGDMDSFRHVNNVRYVRFVESSRIQWLTRLGEEVGGPAAAADLISGRGVGIILKSVKVDFKRPVTYPDTLLISHRARPTEPNSSTQFNHDGMIYSYAQRKVVATSESVLVWYDYDALKRATPSDVLQKALERRMVEGISN
ncbi:Thioesterase/thiol ester dehydrase-isomerase [Hysterangium stoloniferum]|nr:Thioesterase/thiol ester dehydrase-isomerase [Hysterangium stoloniferum]